MQEATSKVYFNSKNSNWNNAKNDGFDIAALDGNYGVS